VAAQPDLRGGTAEPAGLLPPSASSFPQPPIDYVALGDSFSSGEGVPPYQQATDVPKTSMCHRSTTAYPPLRTAQLPKLLATKRTVNLAFGACSGAPTANLQKPGQYNETSQLQRRNPQDDLVTITIGGNDAGFTDMLKGAQARRPGGRGAG
jgi:lysophospholipase L1-like esterase